MSDFKGVSGDPLRNAVQMELVANVGNQQTHGRSIQIACTAEQFLFTHTDGSISAAYNAGSSKLLQTLKNGADGMRMQQKLLMGSISPVDFVKEVCPETKTFVAKVKKAVKKTTPAAAAKPAEKKKAAPVKAKAKTTLTNAKESAQAINSSYYHGRKVTPEDEFNQKYAPKKIDPAAVAAEKAAHVAQGHSSWNKSGSWEETDLEAWALADLKTKLTAVTGTDYKVGELTVSFEDWKITGDACMSVGKGKKRINFELIAKVEFKGTLGDAEVKGKITSPNVDDVDGIDGDFDVNLAVDSPRKGPGFTAVKTSMKPLVKDLRKAINAFIKELMSKKD